LSIEELEDQVEKILEERDKLEEICDTLPQCEEDDGCKTCETYKKIAELDGKVEELEEKIESLMVEDEEEE
jgi:predicted transcriptional regulator